MIRSADQSRPRVLLISHGYLEPGLRKQVDEIGKHCELRLVAPDRAHITVFPDYRLRSSSASFSTYRRISLFGSQYLLLSATLGLRDLRPDIVHINYEPWATIFWQTLATVKTLVPTAQVVCGVKKNTYRRYPGALGSMKWRMARAGLCRADGLIAASEMAASVYQQEFGISREAIAVATRVGVDTSVFQPAQDTPAPLGNPPVVGFCGRLSAEKGVMDLVEAVSMLNERDYPTRLKLLGAGDLGDRLLVLSRVHPWLTVEAPVAMDEVAGFLRGLDLFVLPARRLPDHEEHDAHALLQAMACGLPCVATRSGIIPEILEPDDLGVVVEAERPEKLANALEALQESPQSRSEMAARAVAAARRKYSVAAVASSYATIYADILRERDRAGAGSL